MKKTILSMAVLVALLASCDPVSDDNSLGVTNITADELLEGATFSQYDKVTDASGNVSYTAADSGNYIKYNIPSVSSVVVYYVDEEGAENVLSSGASGGIFKYVPLRGSDPNQTLYFRYINQDGEETVASKNFVLRVTPDLSTEMKLLVSNSGTKVWKWNPNAPDGQVWGNLGSDGNSDGKSFALTGNGKWWGVTSEEEFLGQLNHTNDGLAHGDESMEATMVFSEKGTITCYDANGKQIRKGKFSVTDYDPDYSKSTMKVGNLITDAGSILWPYEINSNGNMPTNFEIAYLSANRLVLLYPDNGKWLSSWSEGSFWQFYSPSDAEGCLTDNDKATWTWDDENGCWGNAGYGGFVSGGIGSLTGNTWWTIMSAELAQQITNYGYGLNDGDGATMTLSKTGVITKSSGGKGTFELDMNTTSDLGGYNEGKTWGRFKTTGDGILMPVKINGEGATLSEFDIVYFDDTHFVICAPSYFKADGRQSWEECTFWRFKKK